MRTKCVPAGVLQKSTLWHVERCVGNARMMHFSVLYPYRILYADLPAYALSKCQLRAQLYMGRTL